MTSEGMVRDTTDAEVDASILSHLREWWLTVSRRDKYSLGHEEVDLLMRVADERDALRRAACAEPDEPHGDTRYVIDTCGACGHEPHGVGYLCIRQTCPCRNDRSFQ